MSLFHWRKPFADLRNGKRRIRLLALPFTSLTMLRRTRRSPPENSVLNEIIGEQMGFHGEVVPTLQIAHLKRGVSLRNESSNLLHHSPLVRG